MPLRSLTLLLGLLAFLTLPATSLGEVTTFVETFDSDAGFTKEDGSGAPVTFFSAGADSFFGISDGVGGDFGGDPVPTGLEFSPLDGSFLTLEDLDSQGLTLPLVLRWQNIDIANLSDIRIEALVAAFASTGFEAGDFFVVAASVDGGPYETVADYRAGSPGQLCSDTNGDGVGDGFCLRPSLHSFTGWALGDTGSSLDLELRISTDEVDERVAVDTLRVTGDRELEWALAATGDFFVAGNWSPALVPGNGDLLRIRNGGRAVADGTLPGNPMSLDLVELVVGDHQGAGDFESTGLDLLFTDSLTVAKVLSGDAPSSGALTLQGDAVVRESTLLDAGNDIEVASVRALGTSEVQATSAVRIENVGTVDVADDIQIGEPRAFDNAHATTIADFQLLGADLVEVSEDFEMALTETDNGSGAGRATAEADITALVDDVTFFEVRDDFNVVTSLAGPDESVIAEVDLVLHDIDLLSIGDDFRMPYLRAVDGVGASASSNELSLDMRIENSAVEVGGNLHWGSVGVFEDANLDSSVGVVLVDSTIENLPGEIDIEIGSLTGGGGSDTNRLHTEVSLTRSSMSAVDLLASGFSDGVTPGSHQAITILDEASSWTAGHLVLGTASRMRIHLDGTASVLDGAVGDADTHSAISATEADLEGSIVAVFDYLPTAGSHSFDLLVTGSATALDDASASLEVEGLIAGFGVDFFGVVEEGGVDRLRLTISGAPQADLSVSNASTTSPIVPGLPATFRTEARNHGPADVIGASLRNDFASLEGCTWTCTASGGAACAASGSGELDELVDLPVGGHLVYQASCPVDPGAIGLLASRASLLASAVILDPDPFDNFADTLLVLSPRADLSISVDDGVPIYQPGGVLVYSIVAENSGPSHAPGSTITDHFPDLLLDCAWECAESGGAGCGNLTGVGDIEQTVDLPAGGSVAFLAACAVMEEVPSEALINEAVIATSTLVTDPNPADNQAIDIDESRKSALWIDGFESGDLDAWSEVEPGIEPGIEP